MPFFTIRWNFSINKIIPLLHAFAVSSTPLAQNILLFESAKIIEKAAEYHAFPTPMHHVLPPIKSPITASFTLLFESHADLRAFIESL